MSCDWDVRCVTCEVNAGIDNANHQLDLMFALVEKARTLQMLAQTVAADPRLWGLEIRICGWDVPRDFFLEHGGHVLRPANEYGEYGDKCGAGWICPECGVGVSCVRYEHPRDPYDHHHSTSDYHVHHSPKPEADK